MKKSLKFIFLAIALASTARAAESDNFGGLGISVYTGKNGVMVVGIMPNSPAYNIGLQEGNLISTKTFAEVCSDGAELPLKDIKLHHSGNALGKRYRSQARDCRRCPMKAQCCKN
jgi:hypothetical protein